MTKLTKLEKDLIEKAIEHTDGSNSFLFDTAIFIGKELGWSINKTKGVYGSLEKKGIIFDGETDVEWGKVYYWCPPVNHDRYETCEFVNTIEKMEKYLEEKGVA
jgi:hypothetical protein